MLTKTTRTFDVLKQTRFQRRRGIALVTAMVTTLSVAALMTTLTHSLIMAQRVAEGQVGKALARHAAISGMDLSHYVLTLSSNSLDYELSVDGEIMHGILEAGDPGRGFYVDFFPLQGEDGERRLKIEVKGYYNMFEENLTAVAIQENENAMGDYAVASGGKITVTESVTMGGLYGKVHANEMVNVEGVDIKTVPDKDGVVYETKITQSEDDPLPEEPVELAESVEIPELTDDLLSDVDKRYEEKAVEKLHFGADGSIKEGEDEVQEPYDPFGEGDLGGELVPGVDGFMYNPETMAWEYHGEEGGVKNNTVYVFETDVNFHDGVGRGDLNGTGKKVSFITGGQMVLEPGVTDVNLKPLDGFTKEHINSGRIALFAKEDVVGTDAQITVHEGSVVAGGVIVDTLTLKDGSLVVTGDALLDNFYSVYDGEPILYNEGPYLAGKYLEGYAGDQNAASFPGFDPPRGPKGKGEDKLPPGGGVGGGGGGANDMPGMGHGGGLGGGSVPEVH